MKNILISVCAAILVVLLALNTPASFWSVSKYLKSNVFGNVGYTALTSTDNLADFPSLWNTTLTAFDNGKTDSASTSVKAITTLESLVTVGALSSGSLASGFTPVTVPLGGTGSTTLLQYAVLVGSSTNAIHAVEGLGTSGQFLTSNGVGAKPSWQTASVNQNVEYTWTKHHIFSSLFATLASSTNATTTGSAYFTQSGLLSSLLKTDSNGKLTAAVANTDYAKAQYVFSTTTSTNVAAASYASSTALTIPAGVLTASSTIEFRGGGSCVATGGGPASCTFYLRDSAGNTFISAGFAESATSRTYAGVITATITSNNATNAQRSTAQVTAFDTGSINAIACCTGGSVGGTSAIDFSQEVTFVVVFQQSTAQGTFIMQPYSIIVRP